MKKQTVLLAALLAGAQAFTAEPVRFSAGIMTDTHVGSWFTKDASHVKTAAELFRREGVDAIVNVGDICDSHDPRFYRMYREAVDEVFPPEKPRPTEYFVYAWHDSYAYKGHPRSDSVKDSPQAFADVQAALRSANAPNDRAEIAGYPLLFFHQFSAKDLRETVLSETEARYPGKPIFVFDHVPAGGTVDRSEDWGDSGLRAVYNRHPRVIHVSGHAHGSLRNERNIWQGEFTEVSAGCLQVWSKNSIRNYDVMTMEVREHSVTFKRFDIRTGTEIGADARWTIPLPFDPATAPFRPEARRAQATAVEFAPGGALSVATAAGDRKKEPQVVVSLPPLADGRSAFRYRVRVTGRKADGRSVDYYEGQDFGDFHLRPEDRTDAPSVCTFPASAVPAGARATVEVSPLDFFGPEGRPLRAEITGSAPAGECVYESRKPMDELEFFWCDTKGDRAERAVAADGHYRRDGRTIGLLRLPSAATDPADGRKIRVIVEFSVRSSDNSPCAVGIAGMDKPDWYVLASAKRCRSDGAPLKYVAREYLPRANVPDQGVYFYTPDTAQPCAVRFERIRIERVGTNADLSKK